MSNGPDAAIQEIARAIAAGRFSSRHRDPVVIDGPAFSALIPYAYADSMTGLVADGVRTGRVLMSEVLNRFLAEEHRRVMARNLHAEAVTRDFVRAFDEIGVRYQLLKGIALAHSVYRDPSTRSFGDVDVLLHPEDVQRGLDSLIEWGGRRQVAELRSGFDARFGKDIAVVLRGADIDVHRTLIDGPLGQRIPTEVLATRGRRIKLGLVEAATLDLCDMYVHAGLTAGANDVPPRLVTLRDLLEIEAHEDFNRDQVITRAHEWGVAPAVARAVKIVDQTLLPDTPSGLLEWARDFRPTRRERFLLSCYTGRGRKRTTAVATLAVLPGWHDRMDFALAVLLPSRAYLASRSFGRKGYVRRALSRDR